MKIILTYIVLVLVLFAGWVTNVVWTFHQTELGNLALGILGALAAPIGAVHGIFLWF